MGSAGLESRWLGRERLAMALAPIR